MTKDELIQASRCPVCEACSEYVLPEDIVYTQCPVCKSPICRECDRTHRHEEYHEALHESEEYDYYPDDRDQT